MKHTPQPTTPGPSQPRGGWSFDAGANSAGRPQITVQTSDPGDLVVYARHLIGFHPTNSLVAVSMHGERGRVGVIARMDLADVEASTPAVVRAVLSAQDAYGDPAAVGEGSSGRADDVVVLTVHRDDPSTTVAEDLGCPHGPASGVTAALAGAGVRSVLMAVREGRVHTAWTPIEGTPVPSDSVVAAELVAAGYTVLPDRAALTQSISGTPGMVVSAAAARRAAREAAQAPRGASALTVTRWSDAAARFHEHPGTHLEESTACALLTSADDVDVRDRVIGSFVAGDISRALLVHLSQRSRHEHAHFRAAFAYAMYLSEGSAVATEALARVEPGNSLAALLQKAIDCQMPPQSLRQCFTAHDLRLI